MVKRQFMLDQGWKTWVYGGFSNSDIHALFKMMILLNVRMLIHTKGIKEGGI